MFIQPKGAQIEVLALKPIGHTVVLGTAGSGKTTLALLLAEQRSNLAGRPNVLVVTYNRALVAYMNGIAAQKRGITVENYHKFAAGYLNSINKMGFRGQTVILSNNSRKEKLISDAVMVLQQEYSQESTLHRPIRDFVEEIQFMQEFGTCSLEDYEKVGRIGRASTKIRRENRKWFYMVYEMYLHKRAELGYLYDWDDIAIAVYNGLLEDNRERRYTHIIVDEGQDFSPMMLKSLVKAMAEDGSFVFFGDVAQQIYGNSLSWIASGIKIHKTWKFENNYRNPEEIALFAQDITTHPNWETKGDEYVVPKFEVPAAGVKPVLVEYSSNDKELKGLVSLLKGRTGRNVIIVKNRELVTLFYNALKSQKINAAIIRKDDNNSISDGIYVTTFHSAKGLEFDNVYLPCLNNDDFPDAERLESAESKEEEYAKVLKLFYVAATRAKQGLVMTFSRSLTSLFPVDSKNYIKHRGE